jgi:hypothetical protein
MALVRLRARKERIVTQRLGDELLVYDLDRNQVHCLNRVAAYVWQHCDGVRSTGEIARASHRELGVPGDEGIVLLALKQLGRANLLVEPIDRPLQVRMESRRQLLKRIGHVAVGLPLVATILAPTAANAASCSGLGGSCATLPCCAPFRCVAGLCVV